MFPGTAERVEHHTAASAARQIQRELIASLAHYAAHPHRIDRRLAELDKEWDIERTLEANASAIALAGILLGARSDRRFLLLPAAVTGFLLQHAVQGWCPPLPFFRRLGVRTAAEIARERYALKYLRGDFGTVPPEDDPVKAALEATRG